MGTFSKNKQRRIHRFRTRSIIVAIFATVGILLVLSYLHKTPVATADSTSFSFGAGGDHGNDRDSRSVFDAAGKSGISFFQTNGDLSYAQYIDDNNNGVPGINLTQPAATHQWCATIKQYMSMPFMIATGNHEGADRANVIDDAGSNITDVIAPSCLPERAEMNVQKSPYTTGSNGQSVADNYGREYYYDYPVGAPLARFIVITPGFDQIDGTKPVGSYDYLSGVHHDWLVSKIQEAKDSGLWVVVTHHIPSMTTGNKGNGDPTLLNLLMQKKVDLVLNGHDHNYQRSKQLGGSSCVYVADSYNAQCVVNQDPSSYRAGEGTIVVITGSTGGFFSPDHKMYQINSADGDYQYFAKTMGSNSPDITYGFAKFTVNSDEIRGEFVPGTGQTGGFTDTFTIHKPDTIPPTVNWVSPAADSSVSGMVTFTATASDNYRLAGTEFYGNKTGVSFTLEDNLSRSPAYVSKECTGTDMDKDRTCKLTLDTTKLADGVLYVRFDAWDGTVSTQATPVKLTIDNTKPSVSGFTVTTPSESFAVPITQFTGADNLKVAGYAITTSATAPSASDTLWTATAPSSYTVSATGTYTLYPWVKDAAGTVSAVYSTPREVNVVSGPTAVTLTVPTQDAELTGSVTLQAAASDDKGIARIEFWRGITKLGEATTNPYTYTWDTTKTVNGSYAISAIAYDTDGAKKVSSPVTVTVKNPVSLTFDGKNKDGAKLPITLAGFCTSLVSSNDSPTVPAAITQLQKTLVTSFAFNAACESSATVQVKVDLGKLYSDTSKLKLYKDQADGTVKDITTTAGTSFASQAVDGTNHTFVTYTVTDGGAGDTDGKVNGTIVDPAYVLETTPVTTTTSSGGATSSGTSTSSTGSTSTSSTGSSTAPSSSSQTGSTTPSSSSQTGSASQKAKDDLANTGTTVIAISCFAGVMICIALAITLKRQKQTNRS